jgi:hypothetical protein
VSASRRGVHLVVGMLLALCAATIGEARAASAPGLSLWLDNVRIAAVGIARVDAAPLVPLDALADALGWRVVALTDGARLVGEDRTVVVTAGSRKIRENGETRVLFAEPIVMRNGKLYLGAPDATRLFGVRVESRKGALAFIRPTLVNSHVAIAEVARPATPRPTATPRARVVAEGTATNGGTDGRVVVALDRIGATRMLSFTSETHGGALQTNVQSTGVNDFGRPNATVVIGGPGHSLAVGLIPDPLSGVVFRGSVFDGVALGQGNATYFAGREVASGHDIVGETVADRASGTALTLATVSNNGTVDQEILRRLKRVRNAWGDVTTEEIVGTRGVGFGISARTRGTTFLEADAGYGTHGLPLGPNDAQSNLDVGRYLSANTTAVVGLSTGIGQPVAPFLGLATRGNGLQASASLANRTVNASLGYQSQSVFAQFYTAPGPQHATGFQGTYTAPDVLVDLTTTSSVGASDEALTLRTVRRGPNLIAGVGLPTGGHLAPILGVALPLTSLLSVEGSIRPAGASAHALRLALAMGIPKRRPPSVPTVVALVRAEGASPMRLRAIVDGVPQAAIAAGDQRVAVVRGLHTFAIASEDGTLGSPDITVDVEAAGDGATLQLWPMRTIRGRVVVDPAAGYAADASLAGFLVRLEPGDLTAETAVDGTFFFAPQPIAPNATVHVDQGSLPRELRAPDAVSATTMGDLTLVLGPGLKVERQTF